MRLLLAGLAAAALAIAAALPAAAQNAQSSPFTDAERAALHAEIRAYLLANPDLLTEMISLLEQKQQAEAADVDRDLVAANAEAIFDDGFSWVGGNVEGRFTVVEFLDYQCAFCRRAQPDVHELITSDGDIRLIVKEMPILGPGSDLAARAAVATLITEGPQSYEALHDRLMALQGQVTDVSLDHALTETGLEPAAVRAAMEDPEVDRRLAATRDLAQKLAISGTPTFVFDNRMVRGYLPLARMRDLVSELRTSN
jgi:protein-disulfide isomerase